MPNQPTAPITNAAHAAPPSHVAPSAATPASTQAATRDAHQPGQRPSFGPGPGEEITTVLPRGPIGFVNPAATSPAPGMPVWGPPPVHAVPMFPRPQVRRRLPKAWLTVGTAVVATAVAAGLVINFASGSDGPADMKISAAPASNTTLPKPSSAPEATMPLSALPGVLLDVATLNTMLGATNLVPRADVLQNDTKAFSGGDNDHPECGGVHNAVLQRELDNSGYVAVRIQAVSDPHLTENILDDGAIYYPTAKAANDFVAKQAQAWPKCNGVTLHPDPALNDGIWTVGTVANRGGMLSVISTQEGAEGWQCQRALTARNNVVIDVNSCGFNRTDQAIAIATRMADRVTPH